MTIVSQSMEAQSNTPNSCAQELEVTIDHYAAAREFHRTHVVPPIDYNAYAEMVVNKWRIQATKALETDTPIELLWLRRDGDDPLIDYGVPDADGSFIRSATIRVKPGRVELYVGDDSLPAISHIACDEVVGLNSIIVSAEARSDAA